MPINKITSSNNKRIAKNTIVLYLRMFFMLLVGLYTSRVVLSTLGLSDYGLYNVVGGVVAMFAFLNGALTTSTQRFLNFEIGENNLTRLKLVFSTALLLHVVLIGIVILLAETVGLWFVIEKLNIPEGRQTAAIWCYEFSIIAICISIFQLPFLSSIIAHEKMDIYAYVSMFDVIAKLLIVYLIQITSYDRLIFYGFLILCINIIDAFLYDLYGKRHFIEVQINFRTDRTLFKEMLGFSGWNVIGILASTLNNYGLNVLFNIFFGTIVNAARGISYQVNGIVTQFANNFQLAVKPQVVKYYANNQLEEMIRLVFNSAKYSALLLIIFVVPISLEIDYLLHIWLGNYPVHTPDFVRIVLIQSVLNSITTSVIMAIHASGYLKMVGICAGCFNLLLLPINYFLLGLGVSPEIAMGINVIGCAIETFIELIWLHHYIKFPIKKFYIHVYGEIMLLGLLMFSIPYIIHTYVLWSSNFLRFFVVCLSSLITSLIVFYNWGMPKTVQCKIRNKIFKRSSRLFRY